MNLDVILPILAGALSLAFGGLIDKAINPFIPLLSRYYKANPRSFISKVLEKIVVFEIEENRTYEDRIKLSVDNLKKASSDIDLVMNEFTRISEERQARITSMEEKLEELSRKEMNLTSKIQLLEKVPIEVVDHFENIMNRGERQSANRDYFLFGAGVLISVIITIILKVVFNI